jgi:hypothetical protein
MFVQIHYDPGFYSNNNYLLMMLVFLVSLGECGGAFSLDAWIRGKRSDESRAWPGYLICIQISAMYFYSGVIKINEVFLSGATLLTDTRLGRLQVLSIWPYLISSVALVVVLTELFLGFAFWFRKTRPVAFVVGFGLHAGIFLIMVSSQTPAMIVFGLASVTAYLFFLDSRKESRTMLIPASLPGAARLAQMLLRFDILRLLKPVQGNVTDLTVEYEGQREEGGKALTMLLEAIPPLFLIASVLRLPGLRDLTQTFNEQAVLERVTTSK